MKHLFSLLLFLSVLNTNAQNESYKNTASLQTGINGFFVLSGLLDDALLGFDENGSSVIYNTSATVTYGFSYDRSVAKNFSLGVSMGYNTFSFDSPNVAFEREDGTLTDYGFVDASATRTNISLRPMIHYGRNPKLDMYTGARIGVNVCNVNIKTDIEDLNNGDILNDNFDGTFFAPALIPFGLRYYFTNNIGAGFETHLGAPYWFNIQINGRF